MDIVDLIENNPISKLSIEYNNRIVNKVKETFTESQQQLFVSSFYCYLNYDQTNDYVINLDNIWKWLGFSTKQKAKLLLEKNFILNKDFIIDKDCILLNLEDKQSNDTRGGHNKQTFLLNIRTFKLFCIKAGTEKANEIHEYFVKLEDIIYETVKEECKELKEKLENQKLSSQLEKELLREKTIIEQFPVNTQCVYYGIIDDTNENNEKLIKYGNSNNLQQRVEQHKKTYTNFRLVNAFKVENKLHIENSIKQHENLIPYKRCIEIKKENYTEMLAIDNLSFEKLDSIIKNIISSIEYSPENYIKLLDENRELKNENILLKQEIAKFKQKKNKNVLLHENIELEKIKEEYITFKKTVFKKIMEENNKLKLEYGELLKKNKDKANRKYLRKFQKQADGFYYIDDTKYEKLTGNRQEVWDGIAYRTEGLLTKSDFLVNQYGEIVSKAKSVQNKENPRDICKKRS